MKNKIVLQAFNGIEKFTFHMNKVLNSSPVKDVQKRSVEYMYNICIYMNVKKRSQEYMCNP